MKRFGSNLRKALLILLHPMNKGAIRKVLEDKALVLIGASRLLSDLGATSHTKCINRNNVFTAADLVVTKLSGEGDVTTLAATNNHACPFLTTKGCALLNNNLTAPSLCVKRIIKEDPSLAQLANPVSRASAFISQTVRLLGVRE